MRNFVSRKCGFEVNLLHALSFRNGRIQFSTCVALKTPKDGWPLCSQAVDGTLKRFLVLWCETGSPERKMEYQNCSRVLPDYAIRHRKTFGAGHLLSPVVLGGYNQSARDLRCRFDRLNMNTKSCDLFNPRSGGPARTTLLPRKSGWTLAATDLKPNLRGLFDVHGNLCEWCHDCHDSQDGSIQPMSSIDQAVRGGGWGDGAAVCRSAFRGANVPVYRDSYVGFRLALSPSIELEVKGAKPAGVGTEGEPVEQRSEQP